MKNEIKKEKLTHAELSAAGGRSTFKLHGSSHFVNMANKRWSKKKKK